MVVGGAEEFEDELGNRIHSTMDIHIRGYVKNVDSVDTELDNIIADILKCLDDSTNNSYHGKMAILSVATDEGFMSAVVDPAAGQFEVSIRVEYQFTRGTP
jgi:hypothetical protein